MTLRFKLAIAMMIPAGLTLGCAEKPQIYRWGAYEELVYDMYAKPGTADPDTQVASLSEDITRTQSEGKRVPPGVHAHLGYMYYLSGDTAAALDEFATERALFPESENSSTASSNACGRSERMPGYRRFAFGLCCAMPLFGGGCVAPAKTDYGAYREHLPRSVLVLPPLNQSVHVNAPYGYLSTISEPLAEAGYYVFPVAVVDAFMKENGLPTPGEMHEVPLDKFAEIFGAEAVLYVTIEDYGQKYQVVQSTTIVKARAELVDVATGTPLWQGRVQVAQSSGGIPAAA